ncbi:hypothetical protein V8G54_006356 [Vigna mungo]|uniref:Uncharacterized protein n=1 Tax=Vigna mungo TaxID=3915 RepID=A0AAQ3NZQ5_VIGMU
MKRGNKRKEELFFIKKRVVNDYITSQIKPLICYYVPLLRVEAWARRGRKRERNARRSTRASSLRSRPASSDMKRCCSAATCSGRVCRGQTCCGARSCSCGDRGGALRRCRRRRCCPRRSVERARLRRRLRPLFRNANNDFGGSSRGTHQPSVCKALKNSGGCLYKEWVRALNSSNGEREGRGTLVRCQKRHMRSSNRCKRRVSYAQLLRFFFRLF